MLELLLMFISFCLDSLHQSPPTIPIILSGLRHCLRLKLVDVNIFDHGLIKAARAGVARLPYTSTRQRLPYTFAMVQHIMWQYTEPGLCHNDFMIAVAISMAYYLSLRASEYISKTLVPNSETHQFESQSIEFLLHDTSILLPSHQLSRVLWKDIAVIRFTLQHAKNIKQGFGIPIWFTTTEENEDVTAFLQLVFLWAKMSNRMANDPFLSFRDKTGSLHCLQYTTIQRVIKSCATEFGFNPDWFTSHCLRMAGPTAALAAGASDSDILRRGRWKSLPTALQYHRSSIKSNNNMLRLITDPTLFTGRDLQLCHVLPPNASTGQPTVRRF